MDESLQIQTFEELPSSIDFGSMIESRNVPAVFKGCVKDWKAFSKWNPSNGGLDYLQDRVGSFAVEAMLSRNAPVFYGNLGNHERVPLPFSSFIGFCKQHTQNTPDDRGVCSEPESHELVGSSMEQRCPPPADDPRQIYLAQVPIVNTEDEDRVQLGTLREDIQMPAILETKSLASINMWMNSSRARSSTHYDPHHNLLCIVAGCKQAVLWPPSASPSLYPMPIYGEASNHSSVALDKPELSLYPRAEYSMEHSQKVILHAGDALFIPEGWFHQVDSDDLTIAVNFWWRSDMMSSMSEHMDAYFMRRILRRQRNGQNQVLQKTNSTDAGRRKSLTCQSSSDVEAECSVGQACERENPNKRKLQFNITLQELEPLALQALHELVSLVHQRVDPSYENDSKINAEDDCKKIEATDFFVLEDDPVAKVLWTLPPCTLQNVFLAMAHSFPRTLEALVLHLLSPVGAEVLTRKFDEMDQQTDEEDRTKFYEVFYGVFEDQFAAMDAILKGKESFALKAFKNVLDKYVGINFNGPNPWVR